MTLPMKAADRAVAAGPGNAALSRHIGASLMADEFDMSFFMDKSSTTAFSRRFRRCCPDEAQGWPTAVIPLQIGVLQFPVPSARRCYKLGGAAPGD